MRMCLEIRQFSPLYRLCSLVRKGRIIHIDLLEDMEVRQNVEEIILEVGGIDIIMVKDPIFIMFVVARMDMK